MPTKLSKPKIHELSLVMAHKDGIEWAPRNDEAMVLGFKAAAAEKVKGAIETLKGYFASNDDLSRAYPVAQADDDIDNDDDGADDYNEIASALCQVAYDIGQASSISDEDARGAAVVAAIKSFLLGLDALRAGNEDADKAGAKFSKESKAHIAALKDAHASMAEHLAALEDAKDGGKDDATEGGTKAAEVETLTPPSDATDTTKGDSLAVSTEEVEMTAEEIQAIAKAAAEQAVAAVTAANAEAAEKAAADAKAAIDAANAEAEKAKADALKAQEEADAAKADAAKAQAAQTAAEAKGVAEARKGTAASGRPADANGETPLQRAVKAAIKANPFSPVF